MDVHEEERIETYKRLGELGVSALKVCFLLNGGAAIALLAFVPHALENTPKLASDIANSMYFFIGGVATAAFAHVLAYVMQLQLYNLKLGRGIERTHLRLLWTAIGMVFLSIFAFFIGAIWVAISIPDLP